MGFNSGFKGLNLWYHFDTVRYKQDKRNGTSAYLVSIERIFSGSSELVSRGNNFSFTFTPSTVTTKWGARDTADVVLREEINGCY